MPRKAPLLEPPHAGSTEDQRSTRQFDPLEGHWFLPGDDTVAPRRDRWIAAMRRRVIDTAVALLAEVGPRQFTVLEVARRSGIARTTIYKYFGLKAELLSACRHAPGGGPTRRLESAATRHSRGPVRDCQGLPPALARLRQVLLGMATELQEEGDLWLLTAAESIRARRQPRPYRSWELPTPFSSRVEQVLWRQLKAAYGAGELPQDVDPGTLGRWLGALWWYHLTVRGPHRDRRPGRPGTAAELANELATGLTWLLRGVRACVTPKQGTIG